MTEAFPLTQEDCSSRKYNIYCSDIDDSPGMPKSSYLQDQGLILLAPSVFQNPSLAIQELGA